LLLISAGITILAFLVLPPLVPLLFSGLSQSGKQLTVHLLRVLLPTVAGWAIIGALGGCLNFQRRYGRYQVALIVTNLGILVVLHLFSRHIGIEALAWGWVIGLWLGVLAVWRFLGQRKKYADLWKEWAAQWDAMRQLLAGTGGLSLWFILNQVPVWIERHYAAQLPIGSLSALGYAQRLFQFPLEMVTAIVMNLWVAQVVSMPAERVARQTHRLMIPLAAVTFPAACIIALLARPLITLVYVRGVFDHQAAILTAGPFALYALGLGFHALSAVLVRTFQARGVLKYPLWAVSADVLLTAVLNQYAFHQGWGVLGIAGINSMVAALRTTVLFLMLTSKRLAD